MCGEAELHIGKQMIEESSSPHRRPKAVGEIGRSQGQGTVDPWYPRTSDSKGIAIEENPWLLRMHRAQCCTADS
jgi:hypothetical protein